ncbi:oocyte zinc finger protein XlCOF6.1-like isoform X1 [Etheostoma cragini]|uniref:oocyte zinc finger protein XlCOF6.1-like isoform X1 n=1 Tax=Etheostoma cragini TaxID=417921 RepID=UPI00155E6DCB|nr:oocyte zinc finger protein XlCOF6.1-like isoform X1 [Etheostoma cragini]
MSKVRMLRAFVNQRLTAAAEEIFELFERTIAEYEEELCRSKEENERERKRLDAVFNAHRADISKEKVPPEQQEWSSSLDQEDPEPPHIKEEQEELWTRREGEQVQGPEEAEMTKFLFTPVLVKSEDDEEEPQSLRLHQRQSERMKTESDGEDWRGQEPARYSDENRHPETDTVDKTKGSSEPETEDDDNWTETRGPQSGLSSSKNAVEKPFRCSECGRGFDKSGNLKRHMTSHTGEKPFNCSICGEGFGQKVQLTQHMAHHTGERPFSCSVCKKSFMQSGYIQRHMRMHTGEKPFSCSVCEKRYFRKEGLETHMRTHTGERPFSCSVCKKSFAQTGNLQKHMRIHTGEKPFDCSVCGKTFSTKAQLTQHTMTHTGEKPFSCSVCGKTFSQKSVLRLHINIHTGEKPFCCSVCGKGFYRKETLVRHARTHTEEILLNCS